jgi:hypothetical protein
LYRALCRNKLTNQPYINWNIYTMNAQNLLLRVSALHWYHLQRVFTIVKAMLSKWSVGCSSVTQLHTYLNLNWKPGETTHKILKFWNNSGDNSSSSMYTTWYYNRYKNMWLLRTRIFRKHYLNYCEDRPKMALIKCRNM